MLKNKIVLALLAMYLLITTALYMTQMHTVKTDPLRLFFRDPNIQGRLRDEIANDKDGRTVIISRIYHNKVTESIEVFFTNIYRTADLPYLFSLSHLSSMNENKGRIPMMLPLEFPFFLLASWHLIRHWQEYRRQYPFLIPMLVLSVVIAGLFYPPISPVKTLPLVTTLRIITFIGMYEFLLHSRWLKKLRLLS